VDLVCQFSCAVSLHVCCRVDLVSSPFPDSGASVAAVEAALMSRSFCDGQGLLCLTADDLVALQLPTSALRLLHTSLDALR
jgi:hypothetical protein